MGVSGQHHVPAALLRPGKGPPVPIVKEAGRAPDLDTEVRGKILCRCRGSNPDRPVVQPVVRHYTAWANPAPRRSLLNEPKPVLWTNCVAGAGKQSLLNSRWEYAYANGTVVLAKGLLHSSGCGCCYRWEDDPIRQFVLDTVMSLQYP
jgi:hypothetical protein